MEIFVEIDGASPKEQRIYGVDGLVWARVSDNTLEITQLQENINYTMYLLSIILEEEGFLEIKHNGLIWRIETEAQLKAVSVIFLTSDSVIIEMEKSVIDDFFKLIIYTKSDKHPDRFFLIKGYIDRND